MSGQFHIDNNERLITVQIGTRIEFPDLQNLAESVLNSVSYEPCLPLLLDLRGMRLRLTREHTGSFSQFIIERFRSHPGSVAIVIDEQMSANLSAGIFWLACAAGSTEVFDDYEHALKWLIRREFSGTQLVHAG